MKLNELGRLVICAKDIMKIKGCSDDTAYRELSHLRDALGKEVITIPDYCEYFGLDLAQTAEFLGVYKNPEK